MTNFFEYMQTMMNQQQGFTKGMTGMTGIPNTTMFNMTMPNVDLSTISSTMKTMTEMFTTTNQTTTENIQTILKRGTEHLQETTTEMMNTMKDAISSGDISQITTCQQKYIQTVLDNNFNSAREIMEETSKSMTEMLTTLQTNMKDTTTKAFTKTKKGN